MNRIKHKCCVSFFSSTIKYCLNPKISNILSRYLHIYFPFIFDNLMRVEKPENVFVWKLDICERTKEYSCVTVRRLNSHWISLSFPTFLIVQMFDCYNIVSINLLYEKYMSSMSRIGLLDIFSLILPFCYYNSIHMILLCG